MNRTPLKLISEEKAKPATNEELTKLIPLFVKGGQSHKCGGCRMRIGSEDKADCTIVKDGISLSRGTCNYWSKGPAANKDDIHAARMNHDEAGYIEVPASVDVNCGSCKFFKNSSCALWERSVAAADCCISYAKG